MSHEEPRDEELAGDDNKPLPCPFCAGAARLVSVLRDGYATYPEDIDARAFYFTCNSCAACGGWSKSGTLALRRWNMRWTP